MALLFATLFWPFKVFKRSLFVFFLFTGFGKTPGGKIVAEGWLTLVPLTGGDGVIFSTSISAKKLNFH